MTTGMPSGAVRWPRVLHAVDPGPAGEPDRVVATLLRECARERADVAAAVIVTPGSPAISEWMTLETSGIRVFCYAIPSGRRLRHLARYREAIDEWRPAVVHCHGPRADLLAGWAARRRRVPVVSTVHGFAGKDLSERLGSWLRRRILSGHDALIAASEPVQARLIVSGMAPERVHLLRDPMPTTAAPLTRSGARAELGLPDDALVLGWVGRLTGDEGADVLLESLPWLMDLPLTVSILGDGEELSALQALAERLGVADRICWHGNRREATRLFTAFDCFVACPRRDETPRSLLYAMAAGVPVVAATVGDVSKVVRENEGMRVPPAAPAALALAIRSTLTGRTAALERAARARSHVTEAFAPEPWVARHAAIYQGVLQHARPGYSGRKGHARPT
jgi:glycosyltransferase involved in cell wall biosynthesis